MELLCFLEALEALKLQCLVCNTDLWDGCPVEATNLRPELVSQSLQGYANTVCIPPPPLYTPLRMQTRTQRGEGADNGERGGGREEGCPSFPRITTDTRRRVVYVLFYFVFVFVYLYLLYFRNKNMID